MIFFVGLLLVMGAASGGLSILSPDTMNDLYLGAEVPPCEIEPFELLNSTKITEKGRGARFSFRENLRCQRRIFEYGDRPSFEDFVVSHQEEFAKRIGLAVKGTLSEIKSDIAKPAASVPTSAALTPSLYIEVDSTDDALIESVRIAVSAELSSLLGPGVVARRPVSDPKKERQNILFIKIHMVDDPSLLFNATLRATNADGEDKWLSL